MLKFFKPAKLKCTLCAAEIEPKETFTVTLVMPAQSAMPVGILDKVLAKQATDVICSRCR